ncbi:MAG: T9SS type A sorting domain-containing protein [Bacteroidetes bacterium]|nr:T9SS type A sorting domain-containing protein [Bacteroidota bacterium]
MKFIYPVTALIFLSLGKAQELQSGDIVQIMNSVRNSMPGQGSNKFFIPTTVQINSFDTMFIKLKAGNYSEIQRLADNFGYKFIKFVNSSTNDTFLLLQENMPIARGWGTYIFNPAGSNDLAVEAPHPIWDTNSWELAIKFFIAVKARWFLLAGTHRYANSDSSSDMAHVTQSVFHACHKRISTSATIQIHGFNKSSDKYDGYPDAVISNGTLQAENILYTIKSNYEAKGFTAGVFSASTYSSLYKLGATTNTQGLWSNANGKTFIHVEHDYPLRTTEAKQNNCIDALVKSFAPALQVSLRKEIPMTSGVLSIYPNPFNSSTTISFSLSRTSNISLSLYSVLGQKEKTIAQGRYEPGNYLLYYSAENLSSGIYFCFLETDYSTHITKLVLLR